MELEARVECSISAGELQEVLSLEEYYQVREALIEDIWMEPNKPVQLETVRGEVRIDVSDTSIPEQIDFLQRKLDKYDDLVEEFGDYQREIEIADEWAHYQGEMSILRGPCRFLGFAANLIPKKLRLVIVESTHLGEKEVLPRGSFSMAIFRIGLELKGEWEYRLEDAVLVKIIRATLRSPKKSTDSSEVAAINKLFADIFTVEQRLITDWAAKIDATSEKN